ncbi:hypothetical protein B296_00018196 [Ensete ventricosum]|uniref:Uncharacterized protein n=1 Tax=Ensete ventricosum TaxID=4639 RepID=A0A427B2I7_ENSVE|nr:hypothetical protein B296_00018196 [Ensete ventricosum]
MLLGREVGSVVSNRGRLDPANSDPGDHERRSRSPLAEAATPVGSFWAAAETKGKSKRSTDLKGRIVEEGEAVAGGARGDVVGVSMTGPGNGCFETGDVTFIEKESTDGYNFTEKESTGKL